MYDMYEFVPLGLHFLMNIADAQSLSREPLLGRSWEAFVVEQILRGLTENLIPFEAHHYRTSDGSEVDLVVTGPFGLLPIEIKRGTRVDRRSLKGLSGFLDDHKVPLGVLVNNATEPVWLTKNILHVPATLF